jgi:hypothetical protein
MKRSLTNIVVALVAIIFGMSVCYLLIDSIQLGLALSRGTEWHQHAKDAVCDALTVLLYFIFFPDQRGESRSPA